MLAIGLDLCSRAVLGGSKVAPFVPMVPLAGAAVDMDFVGGGSYPTAQSTLMNAGHTQAIGALLTLMTAAQGSLVLQLKANPTAATYFQNDVAAAYFGKIGTNQFRAVTEASTILTATFGSGDYTAVSKLGVSWSAAGTTVVANNGTAVTSVDPLFTSVPTTVTIAAFSSFGRLTGWTTKLADATLKGFTV